jgi:hypothetical protein
MIEVLKQAYQLLLTEPHAPTVCDQLEVILRQAIAELESQEPVAHCEAGPEFCQQCHKESLPTYGSEEVSKLREVIQSQAKIIADYEKQIDEPAIYPEEAYEMGLEAIAYYTHPPQEQQSCDKRTWVGLTDYEIGVCSTEAAINRSEMVGGAVTFARAIEAKLKQKNGFAEEKNT